MMDDEISISSLTSTGILTAYLYAVRMPVEVRELIEISSSIITSGNIGSNDGADFKLESINKYTQLWVPKVLSGTDWDNICCNYDTLTLLRGETCVQL